jgi:hydroxypyruvate isomerase
MQRFSANLGFLWPELDLLSAIHRAKCSGFDGVEFHWPYDVSAKELGKVLKKNNLKPISINTSKGNNKANENGLSAIPSKIKDARQAIDIAIQYSYEINCKMIHVMAGNTPKNKLSDFTFIENLRYACGEAKKLNKVILIEVLNPDDAPGYYLDNFDKALEVIARVGLDNLKIMFDCYHILKLGLCIRSLFIEHFDIIGHIQIASLPNRDEPTFNEDSYIEIIRFFQNNGWVGYVGAEYKPKIKTDDGIGWVKLYRNSLKNMVEDKSV